MPHSSHTQQTKTHEAAAGYSPRLCNDDLAPTRGQNWSWYNIFSFWMSDVHSMGGYVVSGELLYAWAGQLAGSALPAGGHLAVIAAVRQPGGEAEPDGRGALRGDLSSGVWRFRRQYPGGDPRADRRFAWYGIQTYLAANALMLVLLKFWPSLASLTSSSFLELSALGWLSFATMWLLQAMVFWHGMNAIKRFIDIAGPAVYVSDAGAGRLDCIQDWSGRYLPLPSPTNP